MSCLMVSLPNILSSTATSLTHSLTMLCELTLTKHKFKTVANKNLKGLQPLQSARILQEQVKRAAKGHLHDPDGPATVADAQDAVGEQRLEGLKVRLRLLQNVLAT